MKNDMPAWLLGVAVLLFAGGMMTGEEELAMVGVLVTICSVVTYLITLRATREGKESSPEVERRLHDLEQRLGIADGELDVASDQLQRLRAEREFDRALAAGAPPADRPGTPPGPR
jgi:hypothetical protein